MKTPNAIISAPILSNAGVQQRLQDTELQLLIYEGMLLPHLQYATVGGKGFGSAWSILEAAAFAYRKISSVSREIEVWQTLLGAASTVADADSVHVNLADALVRTQKYREAIALLQAITTEDLRGAKGRIIEIEALMNGGMATGDEENSTTTPNTPGGNVPGVNNAPAGAETDANPLLNGDAAAADGQSGQSNVPGTTNLPGAPTASAQAGAAGNETNTNGAANNNGGGRIPGAKRVAPGTPFAELPFLVLNPRPNPIPQFIRERNRNQPNRPLRASQIQAARPDGQAGVPVGAVGEDASWTRQSLLEYVEERAGRRATLPQVEDDALWQWYEPRYARKGLRAEELYGLLAQELRLAERWLLPPNMTAQTTPTPVSARVALRRSEMTRLLRRAATMANKRLHDSELEVGLYEVWLLPYATAANPEDKDEARTLRLAIVEEAALAYERADNPVAAMRLLRRYVDDKDAPEDAATQRLRAVLAQILLSQGQNKEAVAVLRDAETAIEPVAPAPADSRPATDSHSIPGDAHARPALP